jgi:Uma2 family endonuclease
MSSAPDLAIEVLSPGDRWPAVDRKAQEFMRAGSTVVWAIDPGDETARSHSGQGSRILTGADALTCPDLLGDFALPLLDLWA